ncbi:MAG: hypothetical protein ACFBSD_08735 [Paracoccaceae bacterium]
MIVTMGLVAGAAVAQTAIQEPEPAPPPMTAPEPLQEPAAAPIIDQSAELDALYKALATSGAGEWKPLQQQIQALWSRSESAAMTLLLSRASKAMEEQNYEKALVFLNDLVRLAPDFAEGWNRRATLYFLQKEYGRSVADIQRTLALEPRHFGALAGLGIILDRLDQDADALRVFRRALEIHPHLEGAKEAIERLEPEVEGREL